MASPRVSLHPYTLLDVFTDEPLAGNALAVVHAADGVTDATMHAFARETRLSETTFVQTATRPGAEYRNRIWTVAEELPFAGHPSLGTAVAVALERGETAATYVQQTRAGLQPVRVQRDGDRAVASVLQEGAVFGDVLDPAAVMAAVGLRAGDAHSTLAPQLVSTGLPTLVALVREPAVLLRARLDQPRAAGLLPSSFNLYLCALDGADGARARMFPTRPGETEDPATGSAAGPLLALLNRHDSRGRLRVRQGAEIGRPSVLECALEGDRVRVGGSVVVIATGTLRLPEGPGAPSG